MHNDKLLAVFCANIRYLRKSRGLTQQQMAQLLHISVGYVRRLERGEVPPRLTVEILQYVYISFGISPAVLTGILLDESS